MGQQDKEDSLSQQQDAKKEEKYFWKEKYGWLYEKDW